MEHRPASENRLLPAPLRWPAAALAISGVVVVAVLAVVYRGQTGYNPLDSWVLDDVLSPVRGHGHTLWRVEKLASPPSVVMLTGVLAVVACLLRAWRCAAAAVLGLAVTGVADVLLKHLIGRTLFGSLAMPSGHTAGTTALATALALLLVSRARRPRLVGGLALALVTLAAGVVGVTMTTLRLHYATDTLGGYFLGLAGTLAAAFLVDAVADRARVGSTASASSPN